MSRRALVVVGVLAALAVGAGVLAQDRGARVQEGRRLFVEHGCYGCHLVAGFGTPIASELTHVGTKYPEQYLDQWLSDPKSQKPRAHMPRIVMGAEDVRALAAYLASLR